MNKRVLGAQLSLRCCGTTYPRPTAGPCWQVYVVMTGLVSEWPTYTWPPSLEIPTPAQREAALAELGYTLADGAGWQWSEDTGPEYHDHPARIALLASADVEPLGNGGAS